MWLRIRAGAVGPHPCDAKPRPSACAKSHRPGSARLVRPVDSKLRLWPLNTSRLAGRARLPACSSAHQMRARRQEAEDRCIALLYTPTARLMARCCLHRTARLSWPEKRMKMCLSERVCPTSDLAKHGNGRRGRLASTDALLWATSWTTDTPPGDATTTVYILGPSIQCRRSSRRIEHGDCAPFVPGLSAPPLGCCSRFKGSSAPHNPLLIYRTHQTLPCHCRRQTARPAREGSHPTRAGSPHSLAYFHATVGDPANHSFKASSMPAARRDWLPTGWGLIKLTRGVCDNRTPSHSHSHGCPAAL